MRDERANSDKPGQVLLPVVLCFIFCFIYLKFVSPNRYLDRPEPDNCIQCHSQATVQAAEVVTIHRASTHARAAVSCDGCHGGDPEQTDKLKAHAGKFIGKPDRTALLAMCGKCHERQLDQFRMSRHFPENLSRPRLDCADCHGVHGIGNPPESFSLAQYCASCHGLEYLPPLAPPLQDLVVLLDELNDKTRRLSAREGKLSEDLIKQRKEIRGLTAEIIHPTANLNETGKILRLGEKFKREIGSR
ncbi:MAG: cytochrome c3 family protein [Blastocatellia bacterium]|nr:cytochrome c3 family protein [Blastocatellia bacterium]